MDTDSKSSNVKITKFIALVAPVILLILFSFCYISKYTDYWNETTICCFYTTLSFDYTCEYMLGDYYLIVGIINLLTLLLLITISLFSLVCILCFKGKMAKIIGAISVIASTTASLIVFIEGAASISINNRMTTLSYLPFILEVVLLVVYFVLCNKFKDEFQSEESDNNSSAYKNLGTFIVCLIFIPFWMYVWIYKTTEYLNHALNEGKRNPTNTLLLCLLVPFYNIYWTYISAQQIDKLAKEKGVNSELATICLVLSIFIGIIPPILMQQKINEIETVNAQPAVGNMNGSATNYGNNTAVNIQSDIDVAEEIKKYKELLDIGAITQEEYEIKKASLLNK